jgi:hypothetical protein
VINPNLYILGLFTLCGLLTAIWGWNLIAKGRKTLCWQIAEGIVEQSEQAEDDSLLPKILVSYVVDGVSYQRQLEFSYKFAPARGYTASYVEKFSAKSPIQVYYDPNKPERITLEPGVGRGDWLIFPLGLFATIFGIYTLITGLPSW